MDKSQKVLSLQQNTQLSTQPFEDLAAHTGVESLKDLIRAVRNARAEVNVAPSKPITILVKTSDSDLEAFFNKQCQLHQTLHKSRTLGDRINHPCTPTRDVKRHHRSRNLLAAGRPPQCRRRTGSSRQGIG